MSDSKRTRWSRKELIVAFNLYCKVPFGTFHRSNPRIIELAEFLGRTPSAVSMKLCNFASFDPSHKVRDVAGLSHTSKNDEEIWKTFNSDWEALAFESEKAISEIVGAESISTPLDIPMSETAPETEREGIVRQRLVQSFFRSVVLAAYGSQCAICKIAVPNLLNASHIIPWRDSVTSRADPTNGIALCTLHDRAFDRGLITFDTSLKIVLSGRIREFKISKFHISAFDEFEGHPIDKPNRFEPDEESLNFHRTNIFQP